MAQRGARRGQAVGQSQPRRGLPVSPLPCNRTVDRGVLSAAPAQFHAAHVARVSQWFSRRDQGYLSLRGDDTSEFYLGPAAIPVDSCGAVRHQIIFLIPPFFTSSMLIYCWITSCFIIKLLLLSQILHLSLSLSVEISQQGTGALNHRATAKTTARAPPILGPPSCARVCFRLVSTWSTNSMYVDFFSKFYFITCMIHVSLSLFVENILRYRHCRRVTTFWG